MPSMKNFIPQNEAETAFNKTKKKKAGKGITMADTIQGLSQKNARMWQIIAIVMLINFPISLAINFYAVGLPKTVPVIVTVNESGEANYVGAVTDSYWSKDKIPEIAKVYQIKKFIHRMNTVVIDRDAQRLYVKEAQAIVQGGGVSLLNTFFRENNPFDEFGERICTVDIEEPLKQTESTYIVYYDRTVKTYTGLTLRQERYSILINLGFYQSTPENPLGIYITGFDIKPVQ